MVKIGANLKRERERRVLTQQRLAELSKVGYPTISRIENDHVEPHFSTIRKLAEAMGLAPEELVREEER